MMGASKLGVTEEKEKGTTPPHGTAALFRPSKG